MKNAGGRDRKPNTIEKLIKKRKEEPEVEPQKMLTLTCMKCGFVWYVPLGSEQGQSCPRCR